MKGAHQSGCDCAALRFEVEVDLSAGTAKCNCSYWAKSRFWLARVEPGDIRVSGEATAYRGSNPVAHHLFCPRCGIHAYDRVDTPNMLGRPYFNVSVACLEGVDVDELFASPVGYGDGLNNAWGSTPKETRHL
jgi:hypothetical protein